MEEHKPSRTAFGAAILRAAHQILEKPKVFADPLALRIIGAEAEAGLRADLAAFQTPIRRPQRAGIAARSRFAEDELAKAVGRGVRQYALLGAGLDTFCCRNPHDADGLQVFEVDHPATQAWKRERLAAAGLTAKPSTIFAPLNFERQTLDEGIAAAGFALDQPAFFSWLGVTTYLTRDAIRQTLGFVAARPKGSAIVFTYSTPPDALNPEQRAHFAERAAIVASVNEPWRSFFEPEDMTAELRSLGFARVEDLGPMEIGARFFVGRTDGFQPGPSGHLVLATV
ncbi:MAG TPA: class I SAM-dependent methyltransferase [Candidatus Cybelea sp.]|nr:class I SAM-dependent methyltransferase [Candidatus Cybelea sp.]